MEKKRIGVVLRRIGRAGDRGWRGKKVARLGLTAVTFTEQPHFPGTCCKNRAGRWRNSHKGPERSAWLKNSRMGEVHVAWAEGARETVVREAGPGWVVLVKSKHVPWRIRLLSDKDTRRRFLKRKTQRGGRLGKVAGRWWGVLTTCPPNPTPPTQMRRIRFTLSSQNAVT